MILAYHDLGLLYSKQNLPKAAIHWLLESYKTGEQFYKTPILLCQEYCKLNELDKAREWYNKAMVLCEEVNDTLHIALLKVLYGIYIDRGNIENTLQEGIQFFIENKSWEYTQDFALLLANYYKDRSRYQEAMIYFEKVFDAQRKIFELEALK
ncbi:hypothetical protein GCM10011391_25920 [Pullulanibacillus camelliae]|uniref:Tetratricopeptide repeat protein n=1 Tax=Pullulanibacillus camelliae TaxID=1707096 RepID=A0A8J2YJ35_9BACL|nr:tetratricopeptide repeat protein [Pullulanibacillus camelliae]GGE45881.1 hypothetical protein GCM10011391_25920 [Pullulanibacillus camelliae]